MNKQQFVKAEVADLNYHNMIRQQNQIEKLKSCLRKLTKAVDDKVSVINGVLLTARDESEELLKEFK